MNRWRSGGDPSFEKRRESKNEERDVNRVDVCNVKNCYIHTVLLMRGREVHSKYMPDIGDKCQSGQHGD